MPLFGAVSSIRAATVQGAICRELAYATVSIAAAVSLDLAFFLKKRRPQMMRPVMAWITTLKLARA